MSTPNFAQIKPNGINLPSNTGTVVANPGDAAYNSSVNKYAVFTTAATFLITELTAASVITGLTNTNLSGSAGITNNNLAVMPANTVKANVTGGSAVPTNAALGTVTETTSAVLTLSGWADATIGSPTITVSQATTSTSGYLSATDWNTFNSGGGVSGAVTSVGPVGASPNADAASIASNVLTLQPFSSSFPGVVTASGGGTSNFLRADGAWSPAGTFTSPMTTAGDMIYENATPGPARLPIGSTNQVLTVVAGLPSWQNAGATGVTSVALTAPSIFTVTGSPITSSGTLALSYSGTALPVANGGTGQTSFASGALSSNGTTLTSGTLSIANGGTGATTAASAFNNLNPMTTTGDIIYEASAGTAARLPIGANGTLLGVVAGVPGYIPQSVVGTIVANYFISTNQTPGANTQINFDTKLIDTNSSVTTGSGAWKFTAPTSGNYLVTTTIIASSVGSVLLYKNGSLYFYLGQAFTSPVGSQSIVVPLNSGDYIDIRSSSNLTYDGDPIGQETSNISIALLNGTPSTSGTVVASYGITTGAVVSAGIQLNYDTKFVDTNNAVTTGAGAWKFTAPVAGNYILGGTDYNSSGSPGELDVYKNGSVYAAIGSPNTSTPITFGPIIIPMNVGDYIDVRNTSGSTTQGFANSKYYCTINISLITGGGNGAQNVNGRYYSSTTTLSGSLATVVYATKGFDSTNSYNNSTGIWTCPVSGKYQFNAGIATAGTVALNSALDLQIQQTGSASQISEDLVDGAAGLTNLSTSVGDIFYCIAGDTVKVQVSSGATAPSIVSSNSRNYFSWSMVGT
jgi:hypothetical protein